MADFMDKVKKTIEDGYVVARSNALNLKEMAEELSQIAKLKFEVYQLQTSKKKKKELLGDTVYPFLLKNKIDALKKHETLKILVDDIKNIDEQIESTRKKIQEVSERVKKEAPAQDPEEMKGKITEIEDEIESRLEELKTVKESVDKKKK
ncbi:MAG: hypothetical protein K8R79_04635 [Calditrichales bacterium]|nr:hypothetical protein [Calditrichales bacterium]